MSDRLERLENKQYVEQADLLKLQRGLENHENSIKETRNFNEQTDKTLDNLKEKVERLEAAEERFVDVHARLLANAYYELKSEIVKELSSTSNTLSIKTEPREDPREQSRPRSSTEAVAPPKQNIRSYERPSVTTENAERSPTREHKPLQRPAPYDGSVTWEAYWAQFNIVAQINEWDEYEKAGYLASCLRGPALAVLGNLPEHNRRNLKSLVSALDNRFGTSHQTELSRVKFKTRVKQRDETLADLSSDIERLSKLAYPDASSELQDVLARDQFVDSLTDEDMRLRLKQERPKTLQNTLELAMELESLQLASKQQRYKSARETT